MIDIRIQATDFDPGHQIGRLEQLVAGSVASVTVAAVASDEVTEIHVDHYPALARNVLAAIGAEAEARFGLAGIILIHRHGPLLPGERIAFAAAAAAETGVAFEACGYLIDALRDRAPFWLRETLGDGSVRWR
ncbi:molybdopterin synthase catalytic subunit [Sphingomonas parva]|uniref:Molybdopterin synthase catalytic subunit n=1 Tax=Sphingomonas parva TaxID=2555898 RepID=A0A4Y8ZRM8_9SPHN|nr:molybdenum cofactor biosynthesis protein MoaE [Sphingomonas parva]TFI58663.1 molybdopterin synthase catalytic subunit [Sphingomonas parva]